MKKASKILIMLLLCALIAVVFVACNDNPACEHNYVDGVCTKCNEPQPGYVAPHTLTWSGLDDVEVPVGDDYNVLEGITVTDKRHGDLTSKIVVLNSTDHEAELTELGVWDDFEDFNHNIAKAYTVYYKVECSEDDDKVSEIKSRDITVRLMHNVANGDFALTNQNGFVNWTYDNVGATGSTCTKYDDNGTTLPKFTFPATTGNGWWSAQYYNTVNLIGGEAYRISITAKSPTGKAVSFGFEDKDNGYAMLTYNTAFALTDEYQTYTSFIFPSKNYMGAKAVLYLGYMLDDDNVSVGQSHEVIVKRINIEKVDVCDEVVFSGLDKVQLGYTPLVGRDDFDPMAGVTAKQGDTDLTDKIVVCGSVANAIWENTNYTLSYYIPNENGKIAVANRTVSVKLVKEHPYDILNGEFDQGTFGDGYWTRDVNQTAGSGEMDIQKSEKGIVINIIKPSNADWHIQLRQDIDFVKGQIYDFELKAKSSVNRSISVEFSGSTKWGVNLTTDWQVFNYTYAGTGSSNKRFSFLLGGGGSECNDSTIEIEYIRVTLAADQTQYEDYQLKNSSFLSGSKFWAKESADTFTEGEEGTRKTLTITTGIHGEDWRSQLFQTGLSFQSGNTYKVKAIVKADQGGVFRIEGNGLFAKKEWTLVAGEETICEFEVEVTENKSNIRIGALMGELPQGTNITYYAFEITLVEAETPAPTAEA